ncbi:aldehyde dehydrogenase family protein [Aeromicrobium terrae]|uniref:Aldehyde dehydrogenase n=1 Tax=Aeromicrobium terrae TaxID=2498846 RepID=A0A5C8NED7_9ACTN|nr:aldehyde dehydrogenase family protein [Aeromicrobium terrae]TXL56541.1 aldehyde dehydrogenase family protein [Aeromicrobium terrae]
MTTTEINPASTEAERLEDLMASLRAVHASGRTKSIEWRLKQIEGIERLVTEREADIAAALKADLGRSAEEAWLADVNPSLGEAVYARKHLKKWMRRRRSGLPLNQRPSKAWVQYEPLGVVLVISPWNYPIYLALSPLVAAVAAGNCVVVKPSELAPACSALMADLLPKYLDPEAVVVVEGDGATSQNLLALGFDHVLFTGGTEIGRKIMAGAAPTLTPVTLELGGKSPVVIAADADIEVAARRIAWVKLLNSGQTCIAPDYILVEEPVRQKFVDTLLSTLKEFRSEAPDAGLPIVNERQHQRLASYLEATKGTVVAGGEVSAADCTIQPTVIVDPDPDEPAMTDEIFGPILPIIPVSNLDEAVRFINGRPKPLALYGFTKSKATRDRLADVPAGGTVFNHIAMHVLVPQLPFGGVGDSGTGAYHGEWGFQTFSHRKAVLAKPSKPDPKFVYPPYTDRALKLMRRLF